MSQLPAGTHRLTAIVLAIAALALAGSGLTGPVQAAKSQGLTRTPTPAHFVQVAVTDQDGDTSVCGIKTNGSLSCPNGAWARPVPKGSDFVQLSVTSNSGEGEACALRREGSIACFPNKRVGYGAPVPAGRYAEVSLGQTAACALRRDRRLACWGGHGPGYNPPGGTFSQVSVSGSLDAPYYGPYFVACALRTNHRVICWGADSSGNPIRIAVLSGAYLQITARQGICGLRTDRTIACWNAGYPLVREPKVGRFSPAGYRFLEVSGFCGLRLNHVLFCSGQGNWPPSTRFKQFAAGPSIMCGIKLDGTLDQRMC